MLKKCADDARAFSFYASIFAQGFFVIYHALLLLFPYGLPWAHVTLLSLTVLALAFILATESPKGAKNKIICRAARISVRYAKYCVHLIAISLMLYSFYTDPAKAPAYTLILLVFAVLAFLIQLIAEILGFLCRRYFEELLAAVLSDTETLRSVLDKVQGGIATVKSVKDSLAAIPDRAAEKAERLAKGLKRGFSIFKKRNPALQGEAIEGEFTEQSETETVNN